MGYFVTTNDLDATLEERLRIINKNDCKNYDFIMMEKLNVYKLYDYLQKYFNCYNFVKLVKCIIKSIIVDNPDVTKHKWITRNIPWNKNTKDYVTYKGELLHVGPMFVIKEFYDQSIIRNNLFNSAYIDSVNEAAIGFIMNKLRKFCPTFVFTYYYFTPTLEFKGEILDSLLFTENIEGKTLTEMMGTIFQRDFSEILTQIFLGLRIAYFNLKFIHGNLSGDNIIVRDLGKRTNILYKFDNEDIYVISRWVPVIVDYKYSSIEYMNRVYKGRNNPQYPFDRNILYPGVEIFRLMSTLYIDSKDNTFVNNYISILGNIFVLDTVNLDVFYKGESTNYYPKILEPFFTFKPMKFIEAFDLKWYMLTKQLDNFKLYKCLKTNKFVQGITEKRPNNNYICSLNKKEWFDRDGNIKDWRDCFLIEKNYVIVKKDTLLFSDKPTPYYYTNYDPDEKKIFRLQRDVKLLNLFVPKSMINVKISNNPRTEYLSTLDSCQTYELIERYLKSKKYDGIILSETPFEKRDFNLLKSIVDVITGKRYVEYEENNIIFIITNTGSSINPTIVRIE